MGKVLSVIQRQVNLFNVENRAHRVISKDKPVPAPKYPSTIQEIEMIKTDYPHVMEEQHKMDFKLDDRLRKVFVRSHDPIIAEEPTTDGSRSLPHDRKPLEDTEFGHIEPVIIPQGRFTLKQAIKFIGDHQTNPDTWTAAAIAKEYDINQDKLEKILFYYRVFQVHIPEKMIPKKSFTESRGTQKLLESQEKHQEQK